jgi:hypothetical protein
MRDTGTRVLLAVCLVVGAASAGCKKKKLDDAKPGPPTAATAPAKSPAPRAPEAPPVPEAPTGPPKLPSNTVLRPTFATTEGDINAGTAFLVKREDGKILLLTAHHLFGEAGGHSRNIPGAELPKVFKELTATSSDDATMKVKSVTVLPLVDARPQDQDGYGHDLAAFVVTDPGNAGVLELAPEPPKKGDHVWLAAQVTGSKDRLFHARVEGIGARGMQYGFDDRPELPGTSGAPVVDARGHVVGIHLAGGEMNGTLHGAGGSVTTIRAMLASAAKDAK